MDVCHYDLQALKCNFGGCSFGAGADNTFCRAKSPGSTRLAEFLNAVGHTAGIYNRYLACTIRAVLSRIDRLCHFRFTAKQKLERRNPPWGMMLTARITNGDVPACRVLYRTMHDM